MTLLLLTAYGPRCKTKKALPRSRLGLCQSARTTVRDSRCHLESTWQTMTSFLRERNALVTFQQFQRSRSPIVSGNTHGSVRFNGWRRGNGPCRGIQQSSNYATEHSAQFPEPQTTGDNGLFIPSRKTAVILGGFRQMRSGKDHPFTLCQRNYCVRRLRNVAN